MLFFWWWADDWLSKQWDKFWDKLGDIAFALLGGLFSRLDEAKIKDRKEKQKQNLQSPSKN